MNDIKIIKQNGGLGRRNPSGDMICGLLANGVAMVGGVQLDVLYRLKSVQDAKSLLINDSYDTSNNILVYEHINEHFRVNPDGDMYIMLVEQSVSYADMLDKTKTHAKKMLIEAEGNIKRLGVAYNPSDDVTDFTATLAAIAKAQELADEEFTKHRPVQIHLEGKGFDSDNPTDLRTLNAKNVSVVVGQAYSIAQNNQTYAAIGTELGIRSKAPVNVSIAWVREYNCYGGSLSTSSIGGKKLSEISEGTLETLNDYGTIFFIQHFGRAGLYFNDGHTCTSLNSDFAYQESNETIDKAAREIRKKLLPHLNAPVTIDADAGTIAPEVIKSIENDGRRALELMLKNEEVSDIDIYIDPTQNILSTSELVVVFDLVPTGTNRKIRGIVGYKNPF